MPVRSLQHFCLTLPDMEVGRTFYADFGLEAFERENSMVARCFGRNQDQIVMMEGPSKTVHHICFGTREGELGTLQQNLEKYGTKLLDPPNQAPGDGIWFHDPDGVLVNVRIAESAPHRTNPEWIVNTPGNYRRINQRGYPDPNVKIQPRRLCHILVFSPDVPRKRKFYVDVLGLEISDYIGDFIVFLRTVAPSDHHVIAFMQSDRPGLHHCAFEVGNVDEIEIGARRMIEKGYTHVWGLNRHVQGSNFFHYLRDPWNSMVEYICDIDFIAEGGNWEAKDGSREKPVFAWGPPMPEDFGRNFEANP